MTCRTRENKQSFNEKTQLISAVSNTLQHVRQSPAVFYEQGCIKCSNLNANTKTAMRYLNFSLSLSLSLSPSAWSRVLPDKLTGPQLVKKFPAFYGTHKFITASTSARHLSPSCARTIRSMFPIPLLEDPF